MFNNLLESKENSNIVSNSAINYASVNTQKSSSIKFSINNLLSELSSKVMTTSNQALTKFSSTLTSSEHQKSSTIAAKNHSTLMLSQNAQANPKIANQSQMASSKMMVALHKKCNSIQNSISHSANQSILMNASQKIPSSKVPSQNSSIVAVAESDYYSVGEK